MQPPSTPTRRTRSIATRGTALFDARNAQRKSGGTQPVQRQELRDLQMWSQLAWLARSSGQRSHGPRGLRAAAGPLDDQRQMGIKQRRSSGWCCRPTRPAQSRQISFDYAYYHPVLRCCAIQYRRRGAGLPPRSYGRCAQTLEQTDDMEEHLAWLPWDCGRRRARSPTRCS